MRPTLPLPSLLVATLLLAATGCLPSHLKYTLVIETEPSVADVYDPRTDEKVGATPMEVPIEYDLQWPSTYVRRPTLLDQWSPQVVGEKKPHTVEANRGDSIRLLLVAPGREKLDQTIDWNVTPYDNQTIRRRLHMKPTASSTTLTPEDDVYR